MKTFKDYKNLKTELKAIIANHKLEGTEPSVIVVTASNMHWTKANKMRMKKHYSDGWVFYKTLSYSDFNLTDKIEQACQGFDLKVSEKR